MVRRRNNPGDFARIGPCYQDVTCRWLDRHAIRFILRPVFGGKAMSEYLPKEVRAGLEAARRDRARKRSRLRVHAGGETFTKLRAWDGGFALDREASPHLRGLVDIYDGARHLSQCLIVASSEGPGETVYEFKRATAAVDAAPTDYAPDEPGPAALLPRD